ncbi:MAG TPA: T9SS type A sorting domain-containing protein, partial [Prolixibacteraceae bacterium]|nr:T9SS type A sorting domain-containing protein [Prolixibacteraceae bacterium]
VDINGVSRFSGGIPDIGAFEFEEEIISSTVLFPEKPQIRIYPNPAKDKIILDLSGEMLHPGLNYSLLNLTGKLVVTGKINNTIGYQTIDVQNVKEGMYFFKAWNNEFSFVKKIIIVKRIGGINP